MENQTEVKPRRKFQDSIFGIILFSLLIMIASGLILVDDNAMPYITNPDIRYIIFAYALRITEILIMLIIFSIFKRTRPLLDKFTLKHNKLIPGLIIGICLNGICVLIAIFHKDLTLSYQGYDIGILLFALLSVGIQSASEEILTRLYMFQMLIKRYKSPWVAILTNSILFGILHLFNEGVTVTAIISVIAIGILLSILVYIFDDIWIAIGLHTDWNFMQAFILGLPNSGEVSTYSVFKIVNAKNSLLYDTTFGIEATITAITVIAIMSFLFWHFSKKEAKTS